MTRIIGGLLDVARIARGKLHLRPAPLDLREVLERVLEDNAAQLEERGLTLEVDLPAQPLNVRGDEVRLVQVFDNLIGNALKFTPAPGQLSVKLSVEEGAALVRVRDTGCGIRREMLARVFDSFQQEPRDLARTTGGLGLGLALAKGIVHLHQGSIEAHSDGPGTGAELRVRLPLCSDSVREKPQETPATVPPRRILIVEDNADTAVMLRDVLEARRHAVTVVDNGPAALDFLRKYHADVGRYGVPLSWFRSVPDPHTLVLVNTLFNWFLNSSF
jgi:CheY-like chemotaxis protein